MKIADFFEAVIGRKDKQRKALFSLTIAFQAMLAFLSPLSIQLLGKIVDNAYAKGNVNVEVIRYVLLCVSIFILAVFRSRINSAMVCKVEGSLRKSVIDRLYRDIDGKHRHGEIFTLAVHQSEEFSQDAWQIVLSSVDFLITISVVFIMMAQINLTISLAVVPMLVVLATVTTAIMRIASKTHLVRQEGSRQFASVVSEEISLLKEMRIFPMLNMLRRRYGAAENDKFHADVKHARAVFYSLSAERLSNAVAFGFVIGFGAFLLKQGEITDGQILVLMNYVSALLFQLSQVNYIVDLWMSISAIYMKIVQMGADVPLETTCTDGAKMHIHRICMERVGLSYGDKIILDDYNMHIRQGERVALIGPSGVGKTSLIKAILQLIPLADGTITVDDNREIQVGTIRESIAYQSQTPFFFADTVFENLRWANPDLTRSEAEAVLSKTNLAHLSLDRIIMEKGKDLSGGERQRLSFARCIVKDVAFWILDEPFTQLDAANEAILLKIIKETAGVTMLISTHIDVSGIVDRAIVLKGRGSCLSSNPF